MQNEIRNHIPEEREPEKQPRSAKEAPLVKAADFSFYLNKENLPTVAKWFGFLTFLAILYIANNHQAERMVRKTDKMAREIKELRAEYISIKSDLMYRSKQSQIARRLETSGLKELRTPPKRITYSEKD